MILEMMGWASTRLVRFLGFAALAAHCVEALAPITIKGTKLYDEDGQQFFVKGQPFAKAAGCVRLADSLQVWSTRHLT